MYIINTLGWLFKFSENCPTSQETPQSWANRDGCSPTTKICIIASLYDLNNNFYKAPSEN